MDNPVSVSSYANNKFLGNNSAAGLISTFWHTAKPTDINIQTLPGVSNLHFGGDSDLATFWGYMRKVDGVGAAKISRDIVCDV